MSKRKSYTNWGREFRKTIHGIFDRAYEHTGPINNRCCNPAARMCIFSLIALTLIFSGIGIYSWIILAMLCSILRFV